MKKILQLWRRPTGRSRIGLKMFLAFLLALAGAVLRADTVKNSVHNLAVSGPGAIKSSTEKNVCVFCHTVHKANGVTPLWNHSMSSVSNYVVYGSARLTALNLTVPQPNGSSRLCLSCHDGTVALGSVNSSVTPLALTRNGVAVTTMPAGPNNVGTDLSNDHPVSMDYDAAARVDSGLLPRAGLNPLVKLEPVNGAYCVQCTSCHNPHDNQYGNFLVMDNTGSVLCTSCHQLSQWAVSQHAVSSVAAAPTVRAKLAKSQNSAGSKLAAKVVPVAMSDLGCENCHMNHQSGSKRHLLQSDVPEQNCLNCHDGRTVKKNLAADFQKSSVHPIALNSRMHSPLEDPVNPKTRHVVCADCHNAHATTDKAAVAPYASGALANLTGVTDGGGLIKPLQKEYELCFRCHADSVQRGPATVSRQFPETNTRLQFSAVNQSFHPVERPGKNLTSVPSLIAPWTVNSQTYCTDCHNSDSASKAGGTGANGPHGSIFAPILERNLTITDNQPESTFAYALCYKCHDRNKVLSSQSFRYHASHVVDDKAACTTCHDSHGVANAPHLINFNTTYVTPSSTGQLNYTSTGNYRGVCTLTCHGKDHKNTSY